MALEEVMRTVMAMNVEDKRKLFNALLADPELNIKPFDAINVRQNHELSLALQEMLEQNKMNSGLERAIWSADSSVAIDLIDTR